MFGISTLIISLWLSAVTFQVGYCHTFAFEKLYFAMLFCPTSDVRLACLARYMIYSIQN